MENVVSEVKEEERKKKNPAEGQRKGMNQGKSSKESEMTFQWVAGYFL